MFVSICAYCGKVFQIGRGQRVGSKTYCCQEHANLDRPFEMSAPGTPGGRIESRKRGGGSGYWMLEDGGYWLDEDGGKWVMENYA